jgi:putative membrane protein
MTAWTLVFHIFGLVFWVGALLIVTSVLARHTEERSLEVREAFARTEKRLLNGMAMPGALLTVFSGVFLILLNPPYYLRAGWLHAKLVLVMILIGIHWVVFSRTKSFGAGRTSLDRRACMTMHAAITLIFLGILICVLPGQVFLK